jgi:hypothetical protein
MTMLANRYVAQYSKPCRTQCTVSVLRAVRLALYLA